MHVKRIFLFGILVLGIAGYGYGMGGKEHTGKETIGAAVDEKTTEAIESLRDMQDVHLKLADVYKSAHQELSQQQSWRMQKLVFEFCLKAEHLCRIVACSCDAMVIAVGGLSEGKVSACSAARIVLRYATNDLRSCYTKYVQDSLNILKAEADARGHSASRMYSLATKVDTITGFQHLLSAAFMLYVRFEIALDWNYFMASARATEERVSQKISDLTQTFPRVCA